MKAKIVNLKDTLEIALENLEQARPKLENNERRHSSEPEASEMEIYKWKSKNRDRKNSKDGMVKENWN